MTSQDKVTTRSEIIRSRRKGLYIKHGYYSLLIRILLLSGAVYILLTQVFLITQAKGNDMFPAIKDGDLVIAFRLQKEFSKNDVVIFQRGNSSHLGRIVARENDVVMLDDSGKLLLNGATQGGEILFLTYVKPGFAYPLQVPLKNVYLLGDHRVEAIDSRDFGPISEDQIEGKVITILRRRGL